jgi:GDPmannose 4,6-dehydratase
LTGGGIRTALITGVTGQDGSYLAELLLERGYRVVGTTRSVERAGKSRIASIAGRIELVEQDFSEPGDLRAMLEKVGPHEVYNLAARASSADLFADPAATGEANGLVVARLLEAVRLVDPAIRFFQALSSELFGLPKSYPQNESTPFSPTNPYAAAKLYAYWMVRVYREHHGLHASSGILFNHESPRRDPHFVTRKISRAAARISKGLQERLELGSLDSRRDWSFAGDFVSAMVLAVQHASADDYVLASGASHSVAQFCDAAFTRVGLDYRAHVVEAPSLQRVADSPVRVGDPGKAERQLGWRRQVDFEGLVRMMVDADLAAATLPERTQSV